jgi:hypothetical protein
MPDTAGREPPAVYEAVCEYDALEKAFEAAYMYLDDPPDNSEEWLMNLHNHLVWKSYEPGDDPNCDTVVLTAIDIELKRRGIKAANADPKTQSIIDYLTLV